MQTKLEASNLFLQGLVMWYGHDVMMIIFDVWDVHYCIMATGRSLMVVFKFVKTCVSIHHVIALFQVVVIVAISDGQPWSGAMNLVQCWWWWRSCSCALEMEIKSTRRKAISYHILWIACDVNPLCILSCLDRDGSIIRWSLTLISR
jgi:hypothetical protein